MNGNDREKDWKWKIDNGGKCVWAEGKNWTDWNSRW